MEKIRDYKNLRLLQLRLAMITIAMTFCFLSSAHANNIQITNYELTNMTAGSATADIQFDISWDNSWRFGGLFYDAAWVFAKYSVNDGPYQHATITGVTSTGASGTGLTIDVTADNKGAYIYRLAEGNGALSTATVKLAWARQTDGIAYNATNIKILVFAIEMVHIPQGNFYAGDGTARSGGTNSHFFNASSSAGAAVKITSTTPYISNVDSGIGTNGDIAWMNESTFAGSLPGVRTSLGANFPTGYKSFYIMKYELTQGQYRDFLNTLTRVQQITRVATSISLGTESVTNVYVMSSTTTPSNRNGIRCASAISTTAAVTFFCDLNNNGTANEAADGEWIACNFLSWNDLCAYAAWSGLRPMTELEFEKAARGTNTAAAGGYAWGTTNITNANTINNSGANNEGVDETGNGLSNYGNDGVLGPLRSGFAAGAATTREQSGASYYGILELSGNIWERAVTIANSTGRAFIGSSGSGILSASGNATNADWPGISSGEVTGATGSGFRGGAWEKGSSYQRTSDRYLAASAVTDRDNKNGGRLVRTQ